MGGAALLRRHKVHGDDSAHQQIFQEVHRAEHAAGHGDHQCLRPADDLAFQPCGRGLIKCVHLGGHPCLQLRIALQQAFHPSADSVVIRLHTGDQLHHTLIELRQQHMAQQVQQQPDHDPNQHKAHRPGAPGDQLSALPGLFQPPGKQRVLNKINGRGQQIGQQTADNHRL